MESQTCGDSVRVAMASLLRLIDRLGADAMLGKRFGGVEAFERDVRVTLFAHIEGVSPAETAAGVALAHALVEPILTRLRARADGSFRPSGSASSIPPRLN